MDTHTILHSSEMLLNSLKEKYGIEKIKLFTSLNTCEIPEELEEKFCDLLEFKKYA